MAFAPPDWRPIRLVVVDGQPDAASEQSDSWFDALTAAVADADDVALDRLDPDAALDRLASSCVSIEPDPDRIDCLVTPAAPGDHETASFVAAVREADMAVPVIVHPETGSVADAADATAAGANRYLVRSGEGSDADAQDDLLAAVRELAADHDDLRTDQLGSQCLRAILDHLQQVLFFKDRDGRHVCVSSQVANSHNDSVIGKTDLDLYEAEAGAAARSAYEDDLAVARDGERIVDKEERFGTEHGDANWLSTTKVPWLGPDGERLGLIGITETINERKAREAELERERRRLEAFASFVSHDLRNPVSIASGYLDLVRESGDRDAFENVVEAVERMDQLIDDVRALVEPGGVENSTDWLPLRGAIEDAWRRVDAPDASLSVTVPASVEIYADDGLLGLLLENVLHNAVEHGSTSPDSQARQDAVEHGSTSPRSSSTHEDAVDHGGPDVAIEAGCTADGFYVADDGPGVQGDDPDRVFEYGYTEGGTGLGLAIVTEVAAYHRWDATAADWSDDRSAGGDGASEHLAGGDDVGAPAVPPEERGFDGACFRIGRTILRTAPHRSATAGAPVAPTESTDVGSPTLSGDASRIEAGTLGGADGEPVGPDAWEVRGGGKNLWRDIEEFHLAAGRVPGDARIVARLADLEYASEYSKAGVFVGRASAGEPLSFLGSIGVHGCESIHRPTADSVLSIRNHSDRTGRPIWLRLDRIGARVTCYCSDDGEDWLPIDQHVLELDGAAHVGLAVCSHTEDAHSTALYDNVRITPLSTPEE